MAILQVILSFALLCLSIVEASPQVSFPINSQVPPVARVGSLFDFTFSADTFSSVSGLAYSLSNAPSWLTIDSTTRKLSGTPGQDDKGSTAFNLIATDDTGSVSMPVVLVVSDTPGPQLAASLDASRLSAGAFSGPESVLLTPGSTIAITLSQSTFINTNAQTQYYAICSDNSPIPSWLIFDVLDLSFSGTVPDASSPSQLPEIYDFHVIATDVPGFSSAIFQFRLTINLREFLFSNERFDLNITNGQAFSYTGLKNNLTLDGNAIDLSLIKSVQAEQSSWLSVDNTTLDVSGIPPQDFYGQSFWVYVQDAYGDEANTTIFLTTTSSVPLLGISTPSINVSCGETVSYTIPADAFAVDGFETSVNLGNCSSWLSYNPQNLTFTGKVPDYWLPQVYYVNLTVIKGSKSVSEAIPVTIIRSKAPIPSPFPPNNTTDGTSNSTGNPAISSLISSNKLAIILVCTLLSLVLLFTVLIYCCVRRQKIKAAALLKDEVKESRQADRTSQYRLRSPRTSTVEFNEDWFPGYSAPPSDSDSRDQEGARRVFAKRPDSSILSSIVRKTRAKKRSAAPLVSAAHIGFGHGSVAMQPQKPKPKHIAIRIPGQAHLSGNNFRERVILPNGSYETISSTDEPARPFTPEDDEKMVHPRKPSFLGAQHTIRKVTKSPTPSEYPSPEQSSSPRKMLQSYVHDRATERRQKGIFQPASSRDMASTRFPVKISAPPLPSPYTSDSSWMDDADESEEPGAFLARRRTCLREKHYSRNQRGNTAFP